MVLLLLVTEDELLDTEDELLDTEVARLVEGLEFLVTEETEREETERVPDAREEELATPVERADAPMLREDPPMLLDEPENPPVALLILAGRFDTQWWYPPP